MLKNSLKKNTYFLGILFILFRPAFSQQVATIKTFSKQDVEYLFSNDEIIYLDLKANFRKIFSKDDDLTYFPAVINYSDVFGNSYTIDAKIKTRGEIRKKVCGFPPLELKFSNKNTKNTIFENQQTLKLVTHCNSLKSYEKNTVIEYLIYRMLNLLTDTSFKVKGAVINYIYDNKKIDSTKYFAFFIERYKNMAKRLGVKTYKVKNIHPKRMNPIQMSLVDIFQYMIGNTDYSAFLLHNIKLLVDSAGKYPPLAIPFDFDYSGLVNATYAVPDPSLSIKNVSERLYRGFLYTPEQLEKTIKRFIDKKQDIYTLFINSEFLKFHEYKRIIRYLDEFYEIINNPKDIDREFIKSARNKP